MSKNRLSTTCPEYRDMKSRILSMVDETNHLDYAVQHTADRTTCAIWVTDSHDAYGYTFRILLVGTEHNVTAQVTLGRRLEKKGGISYANKGDPASVDSIMAWLTEMIENVDNGRDVVGGPRWRSPADMLERPLMGHI